MNTQPDAAASAPLPPLACDGGALSIIRRLRCAGHEAYLVGGCVRDWLMGRQPKDWDVATSARPEQVEALFPRTIPVGKAFGVVLVVLPEGQYEVATFRGDGAYSDGRRPDTVVFGGVEADVGRRDFTINALLYDPIAGSLIDLVGGAEDIRRRVVRTVGDPHERFREDRLRLLRAVRFAARTGFALEPATAAAVRALAPSVTGVSAERIGDELVRMLGEGSSARALELLRETGLLDAVLPEVAAMQGVPQPPEFHPEGDVWNHVMVMLAAWDQAVQAMPEHCPPGLSGSREEREILGWAILLHDVGKPATLTDTDRLRFNGHDQIGAAMARDILRRLRRPGHVADAVVDLVDRHMRFIHIQDMRPAKRRRFAASDAFPMHLELHRLDCLGSHAKLEGYAYGLAARREEEVRPASPERLLTGDDLIQLGYAPGPTMGRILAAVDDARLEGALNSREEALAWVSESFPIDGPKPPQL